MDGVLTVSKLHSIAIKKIILCQTWVLWCY